MKILVFVSKWVGLECLKFLIENFRDDEYDIYASDPGLIEIEKYLNIRSINFKNVNISNIKFLSQPECCLEK